MLKFLTDTDEILDIRPLDSILQSISGTSVFINWLGRGPQGPAGSQGIPGPQGPEGPMGPQGKPFTYDDLTAEQKAELTAEVKIIANAASAQASAASAQANTNTNNISELSSSKLDKAGGIVSGNLAVQGNLTVLGTTITTETETLAVRDNIIVTNAAKAPIIYYSGFAINTDETSAYGIMYDPTGDGVKIGLGYLNDAGEFYYFEDQAQFLATRADNLPDMSIPMWEANTNRFVPSGVTPAELVAKNVPNQEVTETLMFKGNGEDTDPYAKGIKINVYCIEHLDNKIQFGYGTGGAAEDIQKGNTIYYHSGIIHEGNHIYFPNKTGTIVLDNDLQTLIQAIAETMPKVVRNF